MKIVVIGGGAMGLIHAAKLSRVANVSLLVRRAEQAQALASDRLSVIDREGQRTTDRVSVSHKPERLDDADLVIVAVKSHQTEEVAKLLAESINNTSVVLSVQNGLGHDEVLVQACGEGRVLLGKTGYAGKRLHDTTVQLTAEGSTVFGERDGAMSERVVKFEQLFKNAGINVEASCEMWSVLWSKFAQACSQNALSAITGKTFGELRERESALVLLRLLSAEMTQLAKAEGIKLQFDPYERQLESWKGLHHRSSMLQDLEAGRRTEIDALNGEAVRRGEQHGVPMPINQSLWLLVKAVE